MSRFLAALSERVLLADGAMGTQVQARHLDVEKDFLGCENCTEILNRSRPDLVREIHMAYLEAGADAVETNSFGGSPITLGEFNLQDEAHALNKRAAELAREAIEEFKGDGRERFVLGSVGPGTKLPSLGQVEYQRVEDALALQCADTRNPRAGQALLRTRTDRSQGAYYRRFETAPARDPMDVPDGHNPLLDLRPLQRAEADECPDRQKPGCSYEIDPTLRRTFAAAGQADGSGIGGDDRRHGGRAEPAVAKINRATDEHG